MHLLSSFQTKTFPLYPILQIDVIIFEFGSFLDFVTFNFAPNPHFPTL